MMQKSQHEPQSMPGRSMASRLVAIITLTAFGLVLAASVIFYWGTRQVLRAADDQVIEKRMNMVADLLTAPTLDEGLVAHEISEDNQGPRQIFMRVISDLDVVSLETPGMLSRLPATSFPDANAAAMNSPQRATITSAVGDTYRVVSMRVPIVSRPPRQAIIQVATDTTLDRDGMAWLRWLLGSIIAAALPVTSAASWLLVRHQLRPLAQISAAAQSVDGANIERRLDLNGMPRELHELGSQFNAMLDRLEQTWIELRQYADTIAHEMRTPINRLQLRSEIALRDANSVDTLRTVVVENIEECERLTRMLKALLFLARADSKQAGMRREPLSVAAELNTVAEFFDASASLAGKSITVTCDAALTLMADRDLLQRAVGNLVANAISHTHHGTNIVLNGRYSALPENEVLIEVSDDGDGIDGTEQARVFERFYRGPSVGQPDDGEHLGLGLAIVKSLVELHGGRVSLTCAQNTRGLGSTLDATPRGAKFTLHFPVVSVPSVSSHSANR